MLLSIYASAHSMPTDDWISSINVSVEGVQREGVAFQVKNITKGNAQWKWEIYASENDSLVATSSEKSPTFSLPLGQYDLLATAVGKNTLKRHFRRLITVLPPPFTEQQADEVIDLSLVKENSIIKDYHKDLRPGYKIMIKGTYHGRFKITGLHGTRQKPVHIINKGQVVINATNDDFPYAMQWSGDIQYVLFDGKADPSIPYGFKITGHPTRAGQVFFIGGELNKGLEMCGVHIVGRQGITPGAAGIQVQPTYTSICNADNWSFEYLRIHHCKIEEASSEGLYLGYFTDDPRDNGFTAYRLGKVLLYRDTIVNSSWDAIQIASADEFEIHDNYVDRASMAGKTPQSSFISWNGGNINGYCYRNTFKNAAHAASVWFGRRGKNAYIYSNLFVEGTYPPSVNTNNFFYSNLNNIYQRTGLYIFNNTIRTTRMACKVAYVNQKDSTGIPVVFAGNAIVVGMLNLKKYPEIAMGSKLQDSTRWTINNQWRKLENENELKVDQRYHPQASSPLLTSTFDVRKSFSHLKGGYYDHDGYPLEKPDHTYSYGCYSGYELYINAKSSSHGVHKSE
jgi:hypothetical protein